jgi:hypothetical protein
MYKVRRGIPHSGKTHQNIIKSMRNPIILEKLGSAAILNQNPIFEMGSKRPMNELI